MIFHLSREVFYMGTEIFTCALIKKKIKFSPHVRKFRMVQLQSHIWLTASSYMVKYLRISSYIRKPFLLFDFATAPIWISLYRRKILFAFLSVWVQIHSFCDIIFICWMIRSMGQWSRTRRMISNTCGMIVILDLSLPRPSWEMLTPSMEIEPPAASIILISYTSQVSEYVCSATDSIPDMLFQILRKKKFFTQKKYFQHSKPCSVSFLGLHLSKQLITI